MKAIKDVIGTNRIIPDFQYDFLDIYNSNYVHFDARYLNLYGSLAFDTYLQEDMDSIHDVIHGVILSNITSLTHLYNILGLTYDPIANVDGIEKRTMEHGEKTVNDDIGVRKNTTTSDPFTMTTKNESNSNDDNTTVNSVSAYNNDNYSDKDKSAITGTTSAISTTTADTEKTTTTVSADATKDSHVEKAFTDIETLERTGNIGVTSTQNLMNQEKDFWISYNFYDYLFSIIFQTLTIPIYVDDLEV